jgi:hypothetical protein
LFAPPQAGWSKEAKLAASDAGGDEFGSSVALLAHHRESEQRLINKEMIVARTEAPWPQG